MKEPYEKRFPIGIQTIVKDRMRGTVSPVMTYQINTRTINGWWISQQTLSSDIKRELLAQAKRFETTYQAEVDTRYVKRYLGV